MELDFIVKMPICIDEFSTVNQLTSLLIQKELFNQKELTLLKDFQISQNQFSISRVKIIRSFH